MSENNIKPNDIETLFGKSIQELTIGTMDGKTESVSIKQLPVKVYPKLLEILDDEIAMASQYTGKPKEWIETLTPESHQKIIEEGERINWDFFIAWQKRRMERQEKIMPGFQQALLQKLTEQASPLPSSSQR